MKNKQFKKQVISTLLSILIVGFTVFVFINFQQNRNSDTQQKAIFFNNQIVANQKEVSEAFKDFNTFFETQPYTEEELVQRHINLLNTSSRAYQNVLLIEPIEESEELHNSAKELFIFYTKVIDEDYRRLIELSLKAEPTIEDLEELAQIFETIELREKELDQNLQSRQIKFAKKYNFSVI